MEHEATIRLSIFLGLFVLLALAEYAMPRRTQGTKRPSRWFTNWGLVIIDTVTLRLLAVAIPLLAVGAAVDANSKGWGLFNFIDLPLAIEFILSVLILDFLIWGQHLITHKVPLLWQLHRVHHADTHMDVTTAIRFHPIEIALSMLLKIGAVYVLGPMAVAVIAFEVMLNALAMFSHSNLNLPLSVDRILRRVIVTPDMHRVHHATDRSEHDSNYGFALSIWDQMFGTYIAQPKDGHDDMKIGLQWQDDNPAKLGWSLLLPFRSK
jgi:sterol desaturase/sphingolipid hydroxylase (fatty acid hydroxylase superfamily)